MNFICSLKVDSAESSTWRDDKLYDLCFISAISWFLLVAQTLTRITRSPQVPGRASDSRILLSLLSLVMLLLLAYSISYLSTTILAPRLSHFLPIDEAFGTSLNFVFLWPHDLLHILPQLTGLSPGPSPQGMMRTRTWRRLSELDPRAGS